MTTQTTLPFSKHAEHCLDRAETIAARTECTYVDSLHLLEAIRTTPRCAAMIVLKSLGIDEDALTRAMSRHWPGGAAVNDRVTSRMRTKDLDRILHRAREEARGLGHTKAGTEHILIGMLSPVEPRAMSALKSLELDGTSLRWQILETLGTDIVEAPTERSPESASDAIGETVFARIQEIEDLTKRLERTVRELQQELRERT